MVSQFEELDERGDEMTMALEGIRVIEVAAFAAGPVASLVLAHYGAEVIKIEPPVIGDPARGIIKAALLPSARYNSTWETTAYNKKSIVINLKMKKGQEVAHRLIKSADAFLSNMQMSELQKFDLSYETLSRINPRLVYAHSTAYGDRGPDAERRGFDLGALARSGMALRMAEDGCPPPTDPLGFLDVTSGTYTALGICLGLLARERTGKGQKVTNSIFGTAVWGCGLDIQAVYSSGRDTTFRSHQTEPSAFYNMYRTKDDKWVALLQVASEPIWHDFCQIGGIPEMEKDPRFDTEEHRAANNVALIAILDRVFATKTFAEWRQLLNEKDFIWQGVQTYPEVISDPQMEANEYMISYDHPTIGDVKFVVPPLKLTDTPGRILAPAPGLGQHTDEILLESGYSGEDIASLKSEGIIA